MATIDRSKFFAAVRGSLFAGHFTQHQVDGMNAILDAWEKSGHTDLRWLADMLGTAIVETNRTMQPIHEYGGVSYFTRLYDVEGQNPDRARKMGNVNPGDGAKFCGRGYVQLTWHANYLKATTRLRELGVIGSDIDLTVTPDLAMRPDIAAGVMIVGMVEGWFTGKKLADYFHGDVADWTNARRIINGLDRATEIGGHGQKFFSAIKGA